MRAPAPVRVSAWADARPARAGQAGARAVLWRRLVWLRRRTGSGRAGWGCATAVPVRIGKAEDSAPASAETICSRWHSEPSRPTARRLPGGVCIMVSRAQATITEACSPSRLALHFNATAVELHGAIDHGESHTGAVLLGREVELENLVRAAFRGCRCPCRRP